MDILNPEFIDKFKTLARDWGLPYKLPDDPEELTSLDMSVIRYCLRCEACMFTSDRNRQGEWMLSANIDSPFHGKTPADLILTGNGQLVMDYLMAMSQGY